MLGAQRSGERGVPPAILLGGAIVAGCLLLVARLRMVGQPDVVRVFIAMYLVLGIGALVAPVPAGGTQRVGRFLVLAIGASAFALSSVFLGGRIPVSHGVGVIAVNSLAAVCEEAFFRRLTYGWLARGGAIVAIVGSALLFALVHVPLYGAAVFWVDLGAGLVLSWQRWASGSWGISAATHVWANLLAVAR